MNMVCVGGECDGQWIDAPASRSGDFVRVPKRDHMPGYFPFMVGDVISETEVISSFEYQITFLRAPTGTEWFLRPAGWSDLDAIEYLLRTHKART